MGVLDQSISRQLLGNDLFELSYNNPFGVPTRRRHKPIRCVPEFKGKPYVTPEKPLTKRDRQRLKKKMKKNKSY